MGCVKIFGDKNKISINMLYLQLFNNLRMCRNRITTGLSKSYF